MSEHYLINSLKIEKLRMAIKKQKEMSRDQSSFYSTFKYIIHKLFVVPADFLFHVTIPILFDVHSMTQQVVLALSVFAGFMIRNHTFSRRAPELRFFWVYQVSAFFMGMVWIYFLINVIIDLIMLFGIQTGIYASLIGLPILSWGNSLGDTIASAAVARDGFTQMAFTGCVSGSLLNLLLGMGLTIIFAHRNKEGEDIEFKAEDTEGIATLVIILASIMILLTLVGLIAANKWSVTKTHAKIIFSFYFLTVATACCVFL